MIKIKKATSIAEKSDHPRFRHAAMIFKGSRFIVGAANQCSTHPQGSGKYRTKHAELRAIIKAKRILKRKTLKGYTIFVARISPSGDIRNSKPCKDCMNLIKREGMKVEWTN